MTRRALAIYTALAIAALYAPIAVMVAFSFNESPYAVRWTGFTLAWYRRLAADAEIRDALLNSATIAFASAALATVLGTAAALAARRSFRGRRAFAALVSLPITIPDIVLAVGLLVLFREAGVRLSLATAAIAHTTFNLSYVAVVVAARLEGLDPSLELAAQDLGATPFQAFRKVTLPAIFPAVLSGALLAFTLSFDDFVVTYFTTGPGNATLPVKIYSMVRFAVTPEINAVSTAILAASLALIVAALRIGRVPASGGGR